MRTRFIATRLTRSPESPEIRRRRRIALARPWRRRSGLHRRDRRRAAFDSRDLNDVAKVLGQLREQARSAPSPTTRKLLLDVVTRLTAITRKRRKVRLAP